MSFLFPKTMAKRAVALSKTKSFNYGTQYPSLQTAINAYDFFCHQYGGLGYFISFVLPWTQAFKARMILSNTTDEFSKDMRDYAKRNNGKTLDILAMRWLMAGAILKECKDALIIIGLLIPSLLIGQAENSFENYDINQKKSFKALLSNFPIFSDIFLYNCNDFFSRRSNKSIIGNLIHTLCNPLKLVDEFAITLKESIDRVIDIGSKKGESPGVIRKGLKIFVAAVFTPILSATDTVSYLTDIPYKILHKVIYEPLVFVAEAWKQKKEDRDKAIIKGADVGQIQAWINPKKSSTAEVMNSIEANSNLLPSVSFDGVVAGGKVVVQATRPEIKLVKILAAIAGRRYNPQQKNVDAQAAIEAYKQQRSSVQLDP